MELVRSVAFFGLMVLSLWTFLPGKMDNSPAWVLLSCILGSFRRSLMGSFWISKFGLWMPADFPAKVSTDLLPGYLRTMIFSIFIPTPGVEDAISPRREGELQRRGSQPCPKSRVESHPILLSTRLAVLTTGPLFLWPLLLYVTAAFQHSQTGPLG